MNNSDNLPILYSFVRCPYAIRARMALLEASINCVLREVNLKHKPASMLEISPKGTVPVLLLKTGEVIDESLNIMNYALKQHKLFNVKKYTKQKQERIKELITNNDTKFVKLVRPYKYPERYPEHSQYTCKKQIQVEFLDKYEKMLDGNQFLFGLKSIADIVILPFIRQFSLVEQEWFYNSEYKNIITWLKLTTSSHDFKDIIMTKHQTWQDFDPLIYLFNN